MVKRFRMIAGPNGSGKSTLVQRLRDDYSVNFYTFVNADEILAQVSQTGAYSPKFPVSKEELVRYAERSTYDEGVKSVFRYFIATENPKINACRVANRHAQGGHDVPTDKIASRYSRSIAQLKDALPYLSRAYIFDNSGTEMIFLAEYDAESGWSFSMPADALPAWFVQAI